MLTPTEEAQTRALIAQEAALLSLAAEEPTIISNLGATDVSLSDLSVASSLADADLLLVKQGGTDKSISGLIVKASATVPDASETVKGIVELATIAEVTTGTDTVRAVTPAGLAAVVPAQLQPISASVAANAITISASALALTFRSTTFGSGAITKVSGTPANLVISSGSTLGTVNAVQSDIVVIAMNNAGTIELAAVNLAGGTQLDETNLITTTAEGGAGAADSASVIYSTTARTNLAYKVLGIIRSTQATAGTWATAPSLIQGAGGQAIAAMASLGYGQTWQDVTGSRALATTYYNTTGKPISASVGVISGGGPVGLEIIPTVNGVALPELQTYANTLGYTSTASFPIPVGASYSIAASGGTLDKWCEMR